MGSSKQYTLDHVKVEMIMIIMSLFLLASWSNQVMSTSSHEEAGGVTYMKHKRLPLVQREAHARAFASFLVTESQSERQNVLQEMATTDNGRIQFLKAKLGDGASESNSASMSTLSTPLHSGHILDSSNYVMTVGLGTPPSELLFLIDTGSDLGWTQCLPCAACYSQHDTIFDPTASTSYKKVPCPSQTCTQLGETGACSSSGTCEYIIPYLDGSYTTGDFATEALLVSGEMVATAYPFGCGHENQGLFFGFDGLLGLSRSPLAFPAQTKAAFGGVFAYCLPPLFSREAGYIEFGSRGAAREAEASEIREVETKVATNLKEAAIPLVGSSVYYIVTVESIEVDGTSSTTSSFNMVVDSGTVITRLDTPLYTAVKTAFTKAATANLGVKQAPANAGLGVFDACFTTTAAVNPVNLFPTLTFTFKGGSAFTLPVQNLLYPIDKSGTYCLALLPLDSSGLSILGNYQQQSRLVTFDIPSSTLSISSSAC